MSAHSPFDNQFEQFSQAVSRPVEDGPVATRLTINRGRGLQIITHAMDYLLQQSAWEGTTVDHSTLAILMRASQAMLCTPYLEAGTRLL